ncbi:hypothetical protein R4I06_04480, partial [Anaplasma bovis]
KKNMHDVSKAINILDPTEGIDKKICGTAWVSSSSSGTQNKETAEKCFNGSTTNDKPTGFSKLSDMFKTDEDNKNTYPGDATSNMGNHTSSKISKDVSGLNIDQKRIVSSAFSKALEGAEMVEIPHNVSNILIMKEDAIDKKICKEYHTGHDTETTSETAGKCGGLKNSATSGSFKQLSHMFEGAGSSSNENTTKLHYIDDKNKKMGEHTSATISKDVSALGREEKWAPMCELGCFAYDNFLYWHLSF